MHLKLGKFEIFVVSDGTFLLDGGTMFGAIPKVIWTKFITADAQNMALWGTNCLLIVANKKKILIETGMGSKLDERQRKIYGRKNDELLRQNLKELGFELKDIDIVIPTHLHIDHAGGFTIRSGESVKPQFSKAKYFLQREEWEAATHPTRLNRATYLPENFLPVLEAGQHVWIEGETEIVPGITVTQTGAHTLGHQVIKICSEGKILFCPGDLIPTRWHVRQTFLTAYDHSPLDVMNIKTEWLQKAVAENWMLHWYHDPAVPFGTVSLQGENFIPKPIFN